MADVLDIRYLKRNQYAGVSKFGAIHIDKEVLTKEDGTTTTDAVLAWTVPGGTLITEITACSLVEESGVTFNVYISNKTVKETADNLTDTANVTNISLNVSSLTPLTNKVYVAHDSVVLVKPSKAITTGKFVIFLEYSNFLEKDSGHLSSGTVA